MLTRSGLGWNDTSNTIDIEDNAVWETYVKTDSNARTMRYKSWPFYKDWIDIFGKDRVTGENAEDFVDMANDILQTPMSSDDPINADSSQYQSRRGKEAGGDYVPDLDFNMNEDDDLGLFNVGQSSATHNTKSSEKRKRSDVDTFD